MAFNPEKLRIQKIDIIKMDLRNDPELSAYDLEDHEIVTEQDAQIGLNEEEKLSKVTLTYKITPTLEGRHRKELSAEFKINFFITVDNYNDLVKNEEGGISVDNHLYVNLIAVAFATGRGIIYSKLHSTHLESVILPVIDPKELVKPKKDRS